MTIPQMLSCVVIEYFFLGAVIAVAIRARSGAPWITSVMLGAFWVMLIPQLFKGRR